MRYFKSYDPPAKATIGKLDPGIMKRYIIFEDDTFGFIDTETKGLVPFIWSDSLKEGGAIEVVSTSVTNEGLHIEEIKLPFAFH